MNTLCFVDGYNLYYGALQGSADKWLDLPALLAHILRVQSPDYRLCGVNYYTSPVIARLASRGQKSNDSQSRYIRALEARGVTVTLGKHRLAAGRAPRYIEGQKADRQEQVRIWQLEEKQTDVNLALGMYRAACRAHLTEPQIEQIVVVSADTDLAPALKLIRADFPALRLGVILPHRGTAQHHQREAPGDLKEACDWMRRYLNDDELAAHHLPERIPLKRKPALQKPDYW